jgi:proline iminopeptidase
LADVAQVIFLDHRGNGRSEDGPRENWNLAQWGDDVHAFCDVLGIVSPIVLGTSFGGMVALAYATRHPEHPSKLVLISTEAAGGTHRERRVSLFERFGGPEVGALARRRFMEDGSHHPIECQADIAAALPPQLKQFERFANCGHAVIPDAPEPAMAVIRNFIERQ